VLEVDCELKVFNTAQRQAERCSTRKMGYTTRRPIRPAIRPARIIPPISKSISSLADEPPRTPFIFAINARILSVFATLRPIPLSSLLDLSAPPALPGPGIPRSVTVRPPESSSGRIP